MKLTTVQGDAQLCCRHGTCTKQTIAFRGHRGEEGPVDCNGVDPPENDGNFRALLRMRIRSGLTKTLYK